MHGLLLLADAESVSIGSGIAFTGLCISLAACFIAVEWRNMRRAQMDTDLKREMVCKGLSAEEIERVLKACGPPRA
jgi:hypothetical protein